MRVLTYYYRVRAYGCTNSQTGSNSNVITTVPVVHGTITITASTTWTVPCGITTVTAYLWGGGGGGGGGTAGVNFGNGGGGGGGACSVNNNIAVVAG